MTKAEAFAGTVVAEFTMATELEAVRRSEELGSLARAEYEARERERRSRKSSAPSPSTDLSMLKEAAHVAVSKSIRCRA